MTLRRSAQLEDAGVGAIVLPSLFEEEILHEEIQLNWALEAGSDHFAEALDYFPAVTDFADAGRALPRRSRSASRPRSAVPVIGSLNATSTGGWTRYARLIEEAGADAVELNLYHVAADPHRTAAEIEAADLEVVAATRAQIGIPLAVKLSPYYSAMANFATRVVAAGADGLVLFNRFYQPDLDLDTLEVVPRVELSHQWELRLPMRWIAILRPMLPDVSSGRDIRHHRSHRRRQGAHGGRRRGDDDISRPPARSRVHPHARGRAAHLDGGAGLRLGRPAARQRQPRHVRQPVRLRAGQLHENAPLLDGTTECRGRVSGTLGRSLRVAFIVALCPMAKTKGEGRECVD